MANFEDFLQLDLRIGTIKKQKSLKKRVYLQLSWKLTLVNLV
ncbi:hypothetical protein BTH41_03642 [Bacillus mycoides]|nr:hypothetical protein BTH41_03642 [Bacillus mycoides]